MCSLESRVRTNTAYLTCDMFRFRLENADVGPMRRAITERTRWLLAVGQPDWPDAKEGDEVTLFYTGDPPEARPSYPSGEWTVRVQQIRAVNSASEMTAEDISAVLGFYESNSAYAGQIWRGAAKMRAIKMLYLVLFDFARAGCYADPH